MRFWLGFLGAFLGLSWLWILGINAQLGNGTPTSRWVFDAYQHKSIAAQKIDSPKVLIVAGSNAMFGIDSGQISEHWQRPTVNLAVNAGLGLDYILIKAQQLAKPGDIIFLPLEYALFLDNGEANSQIIDYVIARDLIYWHQLPLTKKSAYAAGMSPERWIQGLRMPEDHPVTMGTYGAHHLDAAGDQTNSGREHQQSQEKTAVELAATPAKAWHYGERATQESGAWARIGQFANWAKLQKICVIAAPTALLDHASYHNQILERAFYESLPGKVTALGIPYVGKPFDFMYPSSNFFDTDHHLQSWARTLHTRKLIALMQQNAYCSDSSK
nr:hypothetical protein [uncultured Undibacterium sp.]